MRATNPGWASSIFSGSFARPGTTIYKPLQHHGGTLHENLRCRRKRKERYGVNSTRGVLVNQIRIDERPAVVAEKSRIGDWEVDSVIGKGHQQSIVTMVERKTKLLGMRKLAHKTGSLTRDAICTQLQHPVVQTITSDNGKEFSEHAEIAKKLPADFFFAIRMPRGSAASMKIRTA